IISWAYLDLPTGSSSYLALYNILNFRAGVVPVTTVMLQDEEELAFYRGYYRDRSDKNFQEVSFPLCLSPCWGGERICGAFGGCAVHCFAMRRGTVSPVHEGGGGLGQEAQRIQ
ncbi:hypothetical protein E2I00_017368, partial [Balaenoptera physalus]